MFGEILSSKFRKFNYFDILKNNFNFQSKTENVDFFVGVVSKEFAIKEITIPIKKDDSKIEIEEKNDEKVIIDETIVEKEEVILPVEEKKEEIPASLPTEVIQANNLAENYNTVYNKVKIKNETNFNLSEDILTPNIEFSNKKDIVIFHTHTCESYTMTKENSYSPSRKL